MGCLKLSYFEAQPPINETPSYLKVVKGKAQKRNFSSVNYYPYGKTLRYFETAAFEEKFLTTQHERDRETGFDYRGARYYDSDLGRFLSLDPLAAKFPAWSAYNYVLGNPVKYTDPDGKEPEDWYQNTKTGEIQWFNGTGQRFSDANKNQWERVEAGGDELLIFNGQVLKYQLQKKSESGLKLIEYDFNADSGAPTEEGFDYSEERQTEVGEGPAPEGPYWIFKNKIQKREETSSYQKLKGLVGKGQWPGGENSWGNYRWEIYPKNITLKDGTTRGNFFIHGGTTRGSRGCVDLCMYMNLFYKIFTSSGNSDAKVPLIIDYDSKSDYNPVFKIKTYGNQQNQN